VSLETLRSTAWDLVTIAECLRLASRPGEAITSAEVERPTTRWVKRPGRPKPKTDEPPPAEKPEPVIFPQTGVAAMQRPKWRQREVQRKAKRQMTLF
jgi:hypothetical protein